MKAEIIKILIEKSALSVLKGSSESAGTLGEVCYSSGQENEAHFWKGKKSGIDDAIEVIENILNLIK